LLGIAFVIGGLTLAAMKYINPIVAAVLHVVGSLIVVFNSFRLVRSGEELEPHQAPTPSEPHQHKQDAGEARPIEFKPRTV
jgi:Cd2+/Zn2+-exporting ATPase